MSATDKRAPATVIVGPYTYTVEVDKPAIHARSFEERNGLCGHGDHIAQVITLDPDLGPDALAETLLHEVLHCCFQQFPHGLTKEDEERLVGALGFSVLDVLRRNPDLVTALLKR